MSYSKEESRDQPTNGFTPIFRANNITDSGLTFEDLVYVPNSRISEVQRVRCGDIVIAASSGSLDVVGKAAQAIQDEDIAFGAFCKLIRPNSLVHPRYLGHFFKTKTYRQTVSALAAGANINNLRNEHIDNLELPLPPLEDQRRIAAILDQAEALRAKRRQALAKLDTLTQSLFLEMFGDPALNRKNWPIKRFGDVALKFSDGPFGSNLKSEHYVSEGVRVIRLQNIGVGEFVDDDRAYIAPRHAENLRKHACIAGDVLVGTLGDPNLRACIQPNWLESAINKADCVQVRPDPKQATAEWIVGLLNNPTTEKMASGLILGQTRARIAMGRLRELQIPVPPLNLQTKYASFSRGHTEEREKCLANAAMQDRLSASLQHRAFRGEL